MGPAITAWLEDSAIVGVRLNHHDLTWIDRLAEGLAGDGYSSASCVSSPPPRRRRGACRIAAGAAELPETGERFGGLIAPMVAAPIIFPPDLKQQKLSFCSEASA
jgi:type IV secretion system protein TrbB